MTELSSRKRRGIPREDLNREYPSLSKLTGPADKATKLAWVATFTARPDAMHALLADFIKQVHATPGRIGQRPMPKEELVDFHGLLYGEENDLPLREVLPKLVKISERAFCLKIHMSRRTYQRLLLGDHDPDVGEIRSIAAALKLPPTYFVEYRKVMATAAFVSLITDRPGIATKLYKQYLEAHVGR